MRAALGGARVLVGLLLAAAVAEAHPAGLQIVSIAIEGARAEVSPAQDVLRWPSHCSAGGAGVSCDRAPEWVRIAPRGEAIAVVVRGRPAVVVPPSHGDVEVALREDAPPQGLLGAALAGVAHVAEGLDHLAFLLVLAIAAGSARRALLLASLFTLAHAVALIGAARGVVVAPGPAVEVIIALSIAVAAAAAIEGRAHVQGALVLAFGLVHGLGFAGALGAVTAQGSLRSLLALNLGVEAAQLAFVGAVLAVLELARSPRAARFALEAAGVFAGWLLASRALEMWS